MKLITKNINPSQLYLAIVLCTFFYMATINATAQDLDKYGGFMDVTGEKTAISIPKKLTVGGGW